MIWPAHSGMTRIERALRRLWLIDAALTEARHAIARQDHALARFYMQDIEKHARQGIKLVSRIKKKRGAKL